MSTPLTIIGKSDWRVLDPWVPLLKTVLYLLTTQRKVILVQNPSLILTLIACLIKPLKGYKLVQDLHSYFSWIGDATDLRARVYRKLSSFCIRRSDLSIVTNEYLASVIREGGGRPFVLQDRIPDLSGMKTRKLSAAHNIVFICTFSEDEPYEEVLSAARRLDEGFHLYITGRPPKNSTFANVPPNVTFTGYLPDREYLELLSSADALMTLTTCEHTLLCGAYEGIALSKPLIMSDTQALQDYFVKGVVYVSNDSDSLTRGTEKAIQCKEKLTAEIVLLRTALMEDWELRFEALKGKLC
jgi:glycosyltransferase involved in cell wall biosynthesis